MDTPQVGRQFLQQRAVTGQQLGRIEDVAALQRMLAQHPGAETMDGEDRGEVDFIGRHLQAALQCRSAFHLPLQVSLQDLPRQPGIGCFIGRRLGIHQTGGQRQALADALAQLLRSGVGEGHRQDLPDAQAPLHDQPGEQGRQCEGLAGAGTGLDQLGSLQRQRQVGVAGGTHAASPGCVVGAGTRPSHTALKTRLLICSRSA